MNRIIRYTYPRNAYVNRQAFGGLESEISRLFENALSDFAPVARSPRFPVDLYTDKDNTYVRAELPGVTREDINRAIEVARAVTIPSNRDVLHVERRGFTVDGQEGVKAYLEKRTAQFKGK